MTTKFRWDKRFWEEVTRMLCGSPGPQNRDLMNLLRVICLDDHGPVGICRDSTTIRDLFLLQGARRLWDKRKRNETLLFFDSGTRGASELTSFGRSK